MIINTDDDNAYQHLCLIIKEFEEAALKSGKRQGILVVANSPLTSMDNLLVSSDKVLAKVKSSRPTAKAGVSVDNSTPDEEQQKKNLVDIDFDADLSSLFGQDNPVANYVKDCLNCDLRLQFDWQVKPLNLLGGIEDLLGQMDLALNGLKTQMDPYKSVDGICDLLNSLKLNVCVPDLIIALISLKLLLKKYTSDTINISLDWTVLVGPLLKAIVEGIADLLDGMAGVILSPLDCTLDSLYAARTAVNEASDLVGDLKVFTGASVEQINALAGGQLPPGTDLDGVAREYTLGMLQDKVTTTSGARGGQKQSVPTARIGNTKSSIGNDTKIGFSKEGGESALTLPTGFSLSRDTRLEDALKDPHFPQSTLLEKLILPVQDARAWLEEILDTILKSLRSVGALVSGGMRVQLGNIGILLFLSDMIGLLLMIIDMIRKNQNVKDWCKFLEENPQVLQEGIRAWLSRSGVSPSSVAQLRVANSGNNTLLLTRGPEILSEISTCASERTASQSQLIAQWIQELNRTSGNL